MSKAIQELRLYIDHTDRFRFRDLDELVKAVEEEVGPNISGVLLEIAQQESVVEWSDEAGREVTPKAIHTMLSTIKDMLTN